jgi:hypothetical protein
MHLICDLSHPFALLKSFDDAVTLGGSVWAQASSKTVFLMWLVQVLLLLLLQ